MTQQETRTEGPFAGMTEEEIMQKMADDIAVEDICLDEQAGLTDGHSKQRTAISIETKPFAVWVDGEEDRRYAHVRSARQRAEKLFENGANAVAVFDDEKGALKFELKKEEEEVQAPVDVVAEVVAQEEAHENLGDISSEEKLNPYGVASTTTYFAGKWLQDGRIAQEEYRMICQGESTPDEVLEMAKLRNATAAPKKKATANGAKKTKSTKKAKKEKTERKPSAGWSVVVFAEDGKTPEIIPVNGLPWSHFADGRKGFDAEVKRARQEYPNRLIHVRNDASGKVYPKPPKKSKSTK